MKKILLASVGMTLGVILISLFSNISGLYALPLTTPAEFLSAMPYSEISLFGSDLILIQPSSTFFVYFLGLVMIVLGIYFVVTQKSRKSRYYWGIGMILWGISALVAGTSYQAFGYELKCRGNEFCLFTSKVELVYMLLTAYCINYLVAATGFTSVGPVGRKRLIIFAIADSILYTIYLLIGAVVPFRFLISYNGFMAFVGLNFIIMFWLNIRHYLKYRDGLNSRLIFIWLGFLLVNIGYFVFLLSGIPSMLYTEYNIWFNENDMLHVLLILWTLQIFLLFRKGLNDVEI